MNYQSEELNKSGQLFIEKHPKLKTKIVDGSSLAVAIVLHSIPKGTTQVLFRGALSKLAFAIVSALSHRGIQVSLSFSLLKSTIRTNLIEFDFVSDCNIV